MRILFLADIHGETKYFKALTERAEQSDLILVAGDITHLGGRKEAETILNLLREYGKPVYLVPGNCDTLGALGYFKEEEVNLHHSARSFEGYNLMGLGGALPGPLKTPLVFSEEKFKKLLVTMTTDKLKGSSTVLVSHEPPYGSRLDKVMKVRHAGSKVLREWIETRQPLVCLCGHIHESSGIDRLGKTLCANPGTFSRGKYGLLDITPEGPEIQLLSL